MTGPGGAGEGPELTGADSCPSVAEAWTLDYSKPQFPLPSLRLRGVIYWTPGTGEWIPQAACSSVQPQLGG